MSDHADLVAIPRPSKLTGAVLRVAGAVEGAIEGVVGAAEGVVGGAVGAVGDVTINVTAEVVDAVVARIDVNALIESVDINAIVARVDLDALMQRIDIDAIMARVDVDALMTRVDIDAIAGRIEMGPIVSDVMDDVDIGSIVRESTGTITGGVVDSVRDQALGADNLLATVIDTVLLRRRRGVSRRVQIGPPDHEDDGREPS